MEFKSNFRALLLWSCVGLCCLNAVSGQIRPDRICASAKHDSQCQQLQRGNSEVTCVYAQDSIECAQRIRNGSADLGVFTAESTMHVANLGWPDLVVTKEIRHKDRSLEPYDFQSVVIVRSTFTGGRNNLRGLNFCHPGLHYSKSQRWSERFLKHFERSVVPTNCTSDGTSPAEIEASALSRFFNSTCRPGAWSNNVQEDADLKLKFKNLCSLCNSRGTCNYDTDISNHRAALECMRGTGDVAYVSLKDATDYFQSNAPIVNSYGYLCPNGTVQTILNNVSPCVWLRQPWKVIITSNIRATDLSSKIDKWMQSQGTSGWETAIREILTADSHIVRPATALQAPTDYLLVPRPVPVPADLCQTQSIWCTTSLEEYEKCEVVRTAALTSGILPTIECRSPAIGTVTCLNDISNSRADFMGIDSNFGYLARHPHNLTSAMYQETEKDKYSSVVVLVHAKSKFQQFENLRNAKACIPEFGGIASIAFINVGKNRGVFKKSDCDYGKLMGDFFQESCAPGSRDKLHDPSGTNPESLCSLCRATPVPSKARQTVHEDNLNPDGSVTFDDDAIEGDEADNVGVTLNRNVNCAADANNRFYGNRGALNCLNEVGDVAVIEQQNLAEHAEALKLNPNDFRIMCRNGTIARYPGFDVDDACLLTTIVDGEIVVRRHSTKTPGIVNLLSSLDIYLQIDPDFKMYNIYSGIRNLLFEDSALGLVSPNQTLGPAVQNYVRLFENIEDCVSGESKKGAASLITVNTFMTFFITILVVFRF